MAAEVPQTLEYRGGQLNAAPVLEVKNFTNWKMRFMCHIISIEPQFENIISNGPYIPMEAGQRKPEVQWILNERKAANLDQRLKSLIMYVLPDDQINSVINCLTAKSTWNDLILYHERPFDVKESRIMDTFKFKEESELASLFGKLKYEENLIDSIYGTNKVKTLVFATPLSTAFCSTSIVQNFQDSPNDEEDARSNQEYMNDLEEEYQAIALLDKSKRFFKKGTQSFSGAKTTDQTKCHKCDMKDFEAKYNKVKAKLALLSSSALASNSSLGKNKGLIVEKYEWDEEEVSSDENEGIEVKDLMALADEERVSVGKENTSSNKPKLSEAEDSNLSKHDTGKVPSKESQRNTTNHSVVVSDSSVADYDSAEESSVCNTPFLHWRS
ncbi:hypothetical protein Tco_0627932 [Tanacetum coccineum]|uniref:Retrovirus-related Pol polyprotein from transposon TNT 1-94 n=1 Tax=Tanacetum coccineum TaxID=301880 RepID=A0ABQ4WNT9_9ASTR